MLWSSFILTMIFSTSGFYFNPVFEMEDHAIYISVVEIEQDANNKGLVSIKVFEDDLGDALRNFSGDKVPIDLTGDCGGHADVINDYFNKYSLISIDGKAIQLELNSCEIMGDSYWLNFSSETPMRWHDVYVKTVFLMELFPTQTNIISVDYQGEKRMFKLTKSQPENTVSF